MNTLSLSYGGIPLTLNNSNQLIAVQYAPEYESMSSPDVRKIGGFELISTQQAQEKLGLEGTNITPKILTQSFQELPTVARSTQVYIYAEALEAVQTPLIPTGLLYLIFESKTTKEAQEQLLSSYGLTTISILSERHLLVSLSPHVSITTPELAQTLQFHPQIQLIEPDFATPIVLHDTPLKQWHLQNTGNAIDYPLRKPLFQSETKINEQFKAGADAKVVEAWNYLASKGLPKYGSSQVKIAVIDDAFETSHPALAGQSNKIASTYRYTHGQENTNVNPNIIQDGWHGTASASVAAGDTQSGIRGACPNAQLILMNPPPVGSEAVYRLLKKAIDEGAAVISCSWGIPLAQYILPTYIQQLLHSAAVKGRNGKGTIICFSAGNSGFDLAHPLPNYHQVVMSYPTHPDVVAVGSTNSRDERSAYSCHGHQLFIAAPSNGTALPTGPALTTVGHRSIDGDYIVTASVKNINLHHNESKGIFLHSDGQPYTERFSGTSSACPLVAGICALILSARPELTANQVKYIVQATADKVDNTATGGQYLYNTQGHSNFLGYGRINALKAVQMAMEQSEIPSYQPDYVHRFVAPIELNTTSFIDVPFSQSYHQHHHPDSSPIPPPNSGTPQPPTGGSPIIISASPSILSGHFMLTDLIVQANHAKLYRFTIQQQLTFNIEERIHALGIHLYAQQLPQQLDATVAVWTGTEQGRLQAQAFSAGDYFLVIYIKGGETGEFKFLINIQ